MKSISFLATAFLASCATAPGTFPSGPRVDYHQHLVSPAFSPIAKLPSRDGRALLAEMDRAGVRQAVVLSVAYSFADERKKLPDPDLLTRLENDWTSGQVTGTQGRLIGFCSANPRRAAALAELERCLALPGMRGIKLHFGNSGISLRDPADAARIAAVFALADRRRVAILVHMRARGGVDFGARDATLFLDKVVPAAPHVPIVVAHLGGAGPGYPDQNDEVMAVFAAAAAHRDRRMRHLYFDVATNVTGEATPVDGALIAQRLREVGIDHILYGSDLSPPGGSMASGWMIFRNHVPLTAAELARIAGQRLGFTR